MEIQEQVIKGVLIITPMGRRIDASSAPEFKESLLDWINSGHTRILLDLSHVDFIDSSGLGAIVACHKAISNTGGFAITGLKETVGSIFHLTRMDTMFKIFPALEKALEVLL